LSTTAASALGGSLFEIPDILGTLTGDGDAAEKGRAIGRLFRLLTRYQI